MEKDNSAERPAQNEQAEEVTSAASYGRIAKEAARDEPTMILPLPSGAKFRVRRPPVESWIVGGRIPQHLVLKSIQAAKNLGRAGGAAVESAMAALAPDVGDNEAIQILIFARDLVVAAVVSPRIVALKPGEEAFEREVPGLDGQPVTKIFISTPGLNERQLADDEILAQMLHPADFWFVYQWAAQGAKGIPVQTGKGPTTLEVVETFRPGDERRGSLSDAGDDRRAGGDAGV